MSPEFNRSRHDTGQYVDGQLGDRSFDGHTFCRTPVDVYDSLGDDARASRNGAATCGPDDIVFVPQYRGSFDPSGRLNTLLAVVTPLVTSIVAFYFGQKAGSSEGRAATAEANQAISQAQQTVTNTALPQPDKDSLVGDLERAKAARR